MPTRVIAIDQQLGLMVRLIELGQHEENHSGCRSAEDVPGCL